MHRTSAACLLDRFGRKRVDQLRAEIDSSRHVMGTYKGCPYKGYEQAPAAKVQRGPVDTLKSVLDHTGASVPAKICQASAVLATRLRMM